MIGRHTAAFVAVFTLLVTGCASVGPEASSLTTPATSAAPSTPSVIPNVEPSTVVPSVVPSLAIATSRHSPSPKPPKATSPTGPALANLVVSKFVSDDDEFTVGVPSQVRITIKNEGLADAAPFDLGISFTDGVGGGGMTPTAVDGLAAGESVQLPIVISPLAAGNLTYTATADARNVVPESNEDDNTATLSESVMEALPNLVFDSFTLTPDELNAGGFDITFVVGNAGRTDVNGLFEVGFTWAAATGGIGALTEVQCCYADPKLSPGATSQSGESPVFFPSSGTYIVTAALDASSEVGESDETDNYATASVNVP